MPHFVLHNEHPLAILRDTPPRLLPFRCFIGPGVVLQAEVGVHPRSPGPMGEIGEKDPRLNVLSISICLLSDHYPFISDGVFLSLCKMSPSFGWHCPKVTVQN